jgi:hypothetical protein
MFHIVDIFGGPGWDFAGRFLRGTYRCLELLTGPVVRPCIKLLCLLGEQFALALRATYVFFYSLFVYINWYGGEAKHRWTLHSDLPFHIHVDIPYLIATARSPSKGIQDFKRWRRRKKVRWAKPKIHVFDELLAYNTDEEAEQMRKWTQAQTQRRRNGVDKYRHVSVDEENEESEDEYGKEDVGLTVHQAEPVKPVSIGRKEPKRGHKKKRQKR